MKELPIILPDVFVARSAHSMASSLKSGEIILPGEEVYSKYDEAIADLDGDLENVQTAMAEQTQTEAKVSKKDDGPKDDGRRSGALSEAVSVPCVVP